MTLFRSLVLALVCLLSTSAALASHSPWTLDDLLEQESLGEVALSADGRLAAFAVERWEKGEKEDAEPRRTHRLFLVELGASSSSSEVAEPRQLTYGGERIGGVAFSPDGRALAFLSDRVVPKAKTKGAQLWLLPLGGGEARPLTKFPRGVRSFDWIDDDTLLVSRQESASGLERQRKSLGDTANAVDDPLEAPPVRLWRVPTKGEAKRLTTNAAWISEFDVDPSGTRAVVLAETSLSFEFDARVPPEAWIVDLETGERSAMDLAGSRGAYGFRWSPDGGSVWFTQPHSSHSIYRSASIGRPVRWDAASGSATVINTGWSRGLGQSLWPVPGGALAVFDNGVFARPALISDGSGHEPIMPSSTVPGTSPTGTSPTVPGTTGEDLRFIHEILASSDDGRTLLAEVSASDRPTQLYALRLDEARTKVESMRRLTKLNPSFGSKSMPKVEVLRFEGAEGEEVEGLLRYPAGWTDGDEPAPLILAPHGGPAGHDRHAWDFRWSYPNLLWQQRGAFVLEVNYHGSDGYGLDWVESIEQRYYELEIPDLEAGVDLAIERGLADPERLAVAGWSNGGILAAKLVTVTDRYKAAIIGAADVEWVSDWANVDFGAAFDNYYFGGPPWERLEHYLEKSPFFQLPEVTTPSLVHTGTEDRAVPPHQSWSIFRVMQQVAKTDVRLVLYPDEGHGLRKLGHQRRKIEEDVAWMERYLFDIDGANDLKQDFDRAVPDDSPLASRLALAEAAHVETRWGAVYGLFEDGVLVPELVPMQVDDSGTVLDVGRFEVTRAQWAAFDESYDVPAGTGDFPATGVSLDGAKRYAKWLGERLGREVRLPTVDEAKSMASRGGKDGNTLDRWLGHAANPDDAAAIRATLAKRGISLVEPVGSGAARRDHGGAPAVFDFDGNAAEWATDGEGGRPMGPSAHRSSEESSLGTRENDPPSEIIGLRVVRKPAE